MTNHCLKPGEICEAVIGSGEKKGKLPIIKMILLGLLAGLFVGFGAHAAITVMQTMKGLDAGLMKFMGAAVFPVGLILVVIAGAELFTGNNLMTLAVADRKIGVGLLFKNWSIVYVSNFVGSVIFASLIATSGLYGSSGSTNAAGDLAIGIATGKVNLGFGDAFVRGIFCNILVVLAVWLAVGAKEMISKIFAIWFPIMLFVLSGFEHSIANMYFIPVGKFMGADISWLAILVKNLIPVTLGNIVGGSIIIPLMYYIIYKLPKKK